MKLTVVCVLIFILVSLFGGCKSEREKVVESVIKTRKDLRDIRIQFMLLTNNGRDHLKTDNIKPLPEYFNNNSDLFTRASYNYIYRDSVLIVSSAGPDKKSQLTGERLEVDGVCALRGLLENNEIDKETYVYELLYELKSEGYDPSNGTYSSGDIISVYPMCQF